MRETQESNAKWARETFPGGDDLAPVHALRMLDEAVELCRAIGASWAEIANRVNDARVKAGRHQEWATDRHPDPAAVPAELADVAICLDVLAERRGVNLRDEVDRKMAVNRSRRWQSNGDGTGRHIKG